MSSCIQDCTNIPANTPVKFPISTAEKAVPVQIKRDRDVRDVIQCLLKIIPEDQTLLRGKIIEFNLTTIKTTAPRHKEMWNQAPEFMNRIYFQELGCILNEYTGEINTDWKRNLVKVFANQK
jgi:hypothetical protein